MNCVSWMLVDDRRLQMEIVGLKRFLRDSACGSSQKPGSRSTLKPLYEALPLLPHGGSTSQGKFTLVSETKLTTRLNLKKKIGCISLYRSMTMDYTVSRLMYMLTRVIIRGTATHTGFNKISNYFNEDIVVNYDHI